MKSVWLMIPVAALTTASSILGARATPVQTPAVPQCQYAPTAVQTGAPPSCGQVMGFIGNDGKFHQVSSADPLPAGISSGGGGPATIADGADVAEGHVNDASSAHTAVGFLNGLFGIFNSNAPATSAKQATAVAAESTTSGQTGTLANCAVVSGDQAYTGTKSDPVTCTATGRLRVGLSSAGSTTPGTAGSNSDQIGCIYQSSPGTATDGQQRSCQQDSAGNLKVSMQTTTSGGSSTYSINITTTPLAADTNPGQMYGYYFYNNNAAVCYVQMFDLATGGVTLGATTPKLSFGIPANAGANVAFPNGVPFAIAITVAATTARANASACTNGVDGNILFK